jgi:hypothetical protein
VRYPLFRYLSKRAESFGRNAEFDATNAFRLDVHFERATAGDVGVASAIA